MRYRYNVDVVNSHSHRVLPPCRYIQRGPTSYKIVATTNPGNKLSCLPTLIRLNRTAMSNIPIIVQKNRREREKKKPTEVWLIKTLLIYG